MRGALNKEVCKQDSHIIEEQNEVISIPSEIYLTFNGYFFRGQNQTRGYIPASSRRTLSTFTV
jgi:hypothetical protein